MSVGMVTLFIPGKPRAQKRARHGNGFTYTDKEQEAYAATIQGEWIAAGRPVLRPGAYEVDVTAYLTRPSGHYNSTGGLNKKGRENPYPTGRPDVDNYLKQIDALVALGAIPDDKFMVEASVRKEWIRPASARSQGLLFQVISWSEDDA